MPDLFSHLAAARLPAAFLRNRRLAALLVIGTFLPDIAAKGFFWVLRAREIYDVGTHSLVGVMLISYLAALFLEESLRPRGFLALATGGLVHVGVDMLKISFEQSGHYLLYPFSMWHADAGWIDPINVAVLLPVDLVILAVAWAVERSRTRVPQ